MKQWHERFSLNRRGLLMGASASAMMLCGHPSRSFAQSSSTDDASFQRLVEAAQKEGSLTTYETQPEEIVAPAAADFEQRYGIRVEATRLNSSTIASRYAAELQSGKVVADVISVSNAPLFKENPDWWLKLDEETVPGFNAYPKNAVAERYFIIAQTRAVIAYNTNLIKPEEAPKSFNDLLDQRFSKPGTIVIADPRATQSGMSFFWVMVKELGPDYYRALMKQQPDIAQGAGPMTQLLAAGANAVGIGTFGILIRGAIASGAPLGYVYPPEFSTGNENEMGISANAPHPNAARLYASYHMSRAFHEIECKAGGINSPLGDFPGCEPPVPPNHIPNNYDVWNDTAWQAENLPLLGLKPRT